VLVTQCNACPFTPALDKNTPLATAIFYKREMCTLTLLNLFKSSPVVPTAGQTLNSVYNLHPCETTTGNSEDENNGDEESTKTLRFLGNELTDKDLYSTRSLGLYGLILANNWEGINWLVLGDLRLYGLVDFDAVQAAVLGGQFSLALRLIEKLESRLDSFALLRVLTSSGGEYARTLLHTMACLDTRNATVNERETLKQIMKKIFVTATVTDAKRCELISDYLLIRDALGSNAIHYACLNHNFDLLDFVFTYVAKNNQLVSADALLKRHKDAAQQTAYALLFWQLGRIVYTKKVKDKIKWYTTSYVLKDGMNRLEQVARAHFPRLAKPSFAGKKPLTDQLANDYPPLSPAALVEQRQVSPLLYAVNRQNFDMSRFLLVELGFDVNASDWEKASALVYAIRTNNIDLCKLLLNHEYEVAAASTSPAAATVNSANGSSNVKVIIFLLLVFQDCDLFFDL
jgi:ankyrin repeat protein